MIKLELEVKQIDDNIVVCNDKSNIKKFSTKEIIYISWNNWKQIRKFNELFRLERRKKCLIYD